MNWRSNRNIDYTYKDVPCKGKRAHFQLLEWRKAGWKIGGSTLEVEKAPSALSALSLLLRRRQSVLPTPGSILRVSSQGSRAQGRAAGVRKRPTDAGDGEIGKYSEWQTLKCGFSKNKFWEESKLCHHCSSIPSLAKCSRIEPQVLHFKLILKLFEFRRGKSATSPLL